MPKYPYRSLGSFFDRLFRNNLNDNFSDIQSDLEEQKGRVDNLITGTPQPSEVVDARGGFTVLRDRLNDVDESLAQKAQQSDLADIAVNVKALTYGAKGNANYYDSASNKFYTDNTKTTLANDDITAITNAINSLGTAGGRVILPKGTYFVTSTINVPALVTLDLQGSTIVTNADINLVWLRQNGVVFGGSLKVYTPNFTKAALYLDGRDNFLMKNRTAYYNLSIWSYNDSNPGGNGIHYYAGIESTDSHIQWVYGYNVSIENFDKGIMLQNAKSKANTWGQYINGNNFTSINMNNCKYFIYIDGALYSGATPWEITGNVFTDLQIQSTNILQRAFYIQCECNIIKAMCWDIVTPNTYYIEFTSQSKNNRVDLYTPYLDTASQILDNGASNVIVNNSSFNKNMTQDQLILPGTFGQKNIMAGEQDDYLAYMDKRTTGAITQTAGDALTAGALNNVFYPDGTEAQWNTSVTPIVLEVASAGFWIGWIGLFFGAEARNVKIEVYNDYNATWNTILDITGNYSKVVSAKVPTTITHITKIRLTISSPSAMRLSRVFAQSTYMVGQVWLPRIGGNVYGDITYDASHGPVIKDTTNGHTYRLISTNGTLSLQQVT